MTLGPLHRCMEAQEALRQAEAHLKNALELVPRPVGKEELLYMWDNQITALDNFLAETEAVQDPKLRDVRAELRQAKKRLTDAVVTFESQQTGEPVPEDPREEELAQSFVEGAEDMLGLIEAALAEPVRDVRDLPKWEEPLAVVNGYLADSEPFQNGNRELQKARSRVRMARRRLKERIDDVFLQWRKADLASGRDDDD